MTKIRKLAWTTLLVTIGIVGWVLAKQEDTDRMENPALQTGVPSRIEDVAQAIDTIAKPPKGVLPSAGGSQQTNLVSPSSNESGSTELSVRPSHQAADLLTIDNQEIVMFAKRIDPDHAGKEIWSSKFELQPRDEEWAVATETQLQQVIADYIALIPEENMTMDVVRKIQCKSDLCIVDLALGAFKSYQRKAEKQYMYDGALHKRIGGQGETFESQIVMSSTRYVDYGDNARWWIAFNSRPSPTTSADSDG